MTTVFGRFFSASGTVVRVNFSSEMKPLAARPVSAETALGMESTPIFTVLARIEPMSPMPFITVVMLSVVTECQKSVTPLVMSWTPMLVNLVMFFHAVDASLVRSPSAMSGRVLGPSTPSKPSTRPMTLVLPSAKSMIDLTARAALRPKAISPSGPPMKIATIEMISVIQPKISQKMSHADFGVVGDLIWLCASWIAVCRVEAAPLRSLPAASASDFSESRRAWSPEAEAAWLSALSALDWALRKAVTYVRIAGPAAVNACLTPAMKPCISLVTCLRSQSAV